MTTLRPGRAIRPFKIPYSRKSKYKSSNYAKVSQQPKITQYISGNNSQKFDFKIAVISKRSAPARVASLCSLSIWCGNDTSISLKFWSPTLSVRYLLATILAEVVW